MTPCRGTNGEMKNRVLLKSALLLLLLIAANGLVTASEVSFSTKPIHYSGTGPSGPRVQRRNYRRSCEIPALDAPERLLETARQKRCCDREYETFFLSENRASVNIIAILPDDWR